VALPLVNTYNALTSSHAARLAALRDRLPGSVVAILLAAAVLSMVVMGRQQGTLGERRHGATVGFIVLVSLVVWVTLDLNQPNRGSIIVNQEPLERLLAAMTE
jgi:predicted benzoate:H+ symporter BenE